MTLKILYLSSQSWQRVKKMLLFDKDFDRTLPLTFALSRCRPTLPLHSLCVGSMCLLYGQVISFRSSHSGVGIRNLILKVCLRRCLLSFLMAVNIAIVDIAYAVMQRFHTVFHCY